MSTRPEIEKDLARWPQRTWVFLILALLGLQVAGLFVASNPVHARSSYPKFPRYGLGHRQFRGAQDELDDPLLFATAHRNGFSGQAWMGPPNHSVKEMNGLPAPAFFSFSQFQSTFPESEAPADLSTPPDYHLAPAPARVETEISPRFSSLRLAGPLASRGLVHSPELPQTYNDVLGSSVVQVTADRDGTVISARLSESSGLKKADLEALALARQARFGEANGPAGKEVDFGKLIFDWFALELDGTNGVKR